MSDRVRVAIERSVSEPFALEDLGESPAMLLDTSAPIHTALREATGQRGEHSVMFATDAGWLQRAGFECVLYGPGSIEVAHKPNEFLPITEFRQAGEVLDAVIRRSCTRA